MRMWQNTRNVNGLRRANLYEVRKTSRNKKGNGGRAMTAIETLRTELTRIQQAQTACITEEGHCRSECRYEYAGLVRQAKEYQNAIKYLTQLKEGTHDYIRLA